MRKILLLILFSINSFSQNLSISYGTPNTITSELSQNYNRTLIGVNYSFYIGNPPIASYMPLDSPNPKDLYVKDNFSTPRNAFFITIGKQDKNLSMSMRLGIKNYSKYTTFTDRTNCFYYKEPTNYNLLLGASIAYKLEDDFALNYGYDNFNKNTFGFTIYWGKSHKHICKVISIKK